MLLLFLALSLPAFANEVYVQRLLCGVAWSDVACVRGAVRLLSHQQLRQLRVFRLLFSTLCLNTRFRFFKLLASMLDMLLVQLTAWVAVKIDVLRRV